MNYSQKVENQSNRERRRIDGIFVFDSNSRKELEQKFK